MALPATRPITCITSTQRLDPFVVATGPSIPAIERVALFSEEQWEQFTEEWATGLPGYEKVERASGSGDKGCDVIGFPVEGGPAWDNYQCKHYDKPLSPTNIWVEIGKLCYYTFIGDYSLPRRYRFIAPRNVGTKLASYLRRPAVLKEELIKAWDVYCCNHIKSTPVPLTNEFKAHIDTLDFSIFGYTPVLQVIQQHMNTPFYVARFGLGLPPRPSTVPPPLLPEPGETRYVEQLFEAYSHTRGTTLSAVHELPRNLQGHYNRSREAFYSAEALRNFSRDKLPGDEFKALQDQVYVGVADTCFRPHPCGFTRLLATTDRAAVLQITSSPLIGKTDISDLHGICHQLANENRLIWVEQDEVGNAE